ncbi:hypothetical protein D3C76_982200 [compost metagenome]
MAEKLIKLSVLILLAALVGYSVDWIWSREELNIEMQEYVRGNESVKSVVGNFHVISLEKKLISGGGLRPPYRRYTYYVRGDRNSADVEVYLDDSELSKERKSFSLGDVRIHN